MLRPGGRNRQGDDVIDFSTHDARIDQLIWLHIADSRCPEDFRNYLLHTPEGAAHRDEATVAGIAGGIAEVRIGIPDHIRDQTRNQVTAGFRAIVERMFRHHDHLTRENRNE